MKRLAATLLTILLCLTSSIAWSDSISTSDLEKRSGIIYKKRSNIPFTGSVRGKSKDGYFFKKTYKNGQVVGPYESYHKNGQLWFRGSFKNGQYEGRWESYYSDGRVNQQYTGTYRNGKKISD
jgi:hypothetical protein